MLIRFFTLVLATIGFVALIALVQLTRDQAPWFALSVLGVAGLILSGAVVAALQP